MSVRTAHHCAHCRAPLPRTAEAPADAFCCGGCRAARALVAEHGLDRYYELTSGTGTPGADAPPDLHWLAPLLSDARAQAPDPHRLALSLDVQGLHCAACIWLLRALFERHPGAFHIAINPGLGRLTLTFDPERFPLETYLADLARIGYRTGPPRRTARAPSDGLGLRLGITVAIAMNGMALSLSTYLGLDPADPDGLHTLFGWVNLALATLAVLVAGPVFFRGALSAIRHRALHLDVPIALGVALAYLGSLALFFTGRPDLAYFDTLEVFLALMLLGRWVQRRFLDRGRRLLLEDDGLEGARVKLVDDAGRVTLAPLATLAAGDRFLASAGELIPVAATLPDDADPAELHLAWITGESDPRPFTAGATIPAGAHLVGARARVFIARERFSASALHELLAQSAARDPSADPAARTPGDRFWHHLALGWVLTVLAFAGLTALVWWHDDPYAALRHATAVLVVTCPCAIGLATPLAYELAHLALRKSALLPRQPGLLDRARHIRHVVFDKTGTLTLTEPRLANPEALAALDPAARAALAQLSMRSNHPKSRAISAMLPSVHLDPSRDVVEIAGRGLAFTDDDTALEGDGKDLVFRVAGVERARLSFTETLRPDAAAEVRRLHDAGLTVHIASGDSPASVAAIARRLQILPEHTHAGCSPADKAALVRSLGARQTLVLGDGINDALAFDAAAIAGTPALDRPILPARADFVLLGERVGPLAELVTVARRTHRVTLNNAIIAGVYNALALAAGVAGWLSPLVAAVAMPISSVLVIALTFAAQRPRPLPTPVTPAGDPLWMPST